MKKFMIYVIFLGGFNTIFSWRQAIVNGTGYDIIVSDNKNYNPFTRDDSVKIADLKIPAGQTGFLNSVGLDNALAGKVTVILNDGSTVGRSLDAKIVAGQKLCIELKDGKPEYWPSGWESVACNGVWPQAATDHSPQTPNL